MEHQVALTFTDGRTLFIQARPNELLMDAAMRGGVTLPVDCREGVCATCRGHCDSGRYTLDYVDEEALSEEEVADRHILACQTRITSDATFSFNFDSEVAHCAPATTVSTSVASVEMLSDNIAVLTVAISHDNESLTFLPGQYARLQVPGTEEWRAYSFACTPSVKGHWRFIIRLLPEGVMSDYLRHNAKVGDSLLLQGPLGSFYLRDIDKETVFIAGGSGIASFISMLEQQDETSFSDYRIKLLYGANHPDDIYGEDYFNQLKNKYPSFDCDFIISGQQDNWLGKVGYIADHLNESIIGDSINIYMCGPPPMIDSVNQWLSVRRPQQDNIYFEKFIKSNK